MNRFKGIALDMFNLNEHNYPATVEQKKEIRLMYDFIFTKNGTWYYVSSSNMPKSFTITPTDLSTVVVEKGENWKVIHAITGGIIHEN